MKQNEHDSNHRTTQRAAWKALEAHYPKVRELHLRRLFADDPKRGERLTAETATALRLHSKIHEFRDGVDSIDEGTRR